MTIDHNDGTDKPITDQEGVMFAATPAWERGKKRRGFGARKTVARTAPAATVAPEPRTFAAERDYDEPMALDTPVSRPMSRPDQTTAYAMGAAAAPPTVGETLEAEDAGLVAPIGRPSTRMDHAPKSHGIGPAAIAAGAVAVIAAGGIGWYAMRDNSGGVPELTPGTTSSEVASAPLPPVDLPPTAPAAGQRASNILPERAAPPSAPAAREMARAETRAPARVSRTRPAAAASAETSGTNASATIPSGPQPYSTLNPGAAPAPVNPAPAITPPPVEAAPTPEPIPSTPPVTSTEPAPTSPTTPETTTTPETVTPPR